MSDNMVTGRTATFYKIAIASAAKICAAFTAFILTAIVTRNMSNEQAGLFLLSFTLLTVLSIFFRLGLDNVILRLLSAHGHDAFAQEKLNRSLLWIATATLPVTILGMMLAEGIATDLFSKPAFGTVLFWTFPALPTMAITFLLSFAFQAQHRVILATFFQNLGVSILFVIGFCCLWIYQPNSINASTSVQVFAVSSAIVFIMAIILWFRQRRVNFNLTRYRDKELTHSSMQLWIATIMGLATQWSGILIGGVILSPEDIGLLTAAQRTSMLITFILMVMNLVIAPRYARLWKDGNIERIQYLSKWSTRGMILMVIPVVLGMIIWSQEIMSLFGDGYEKAATLLVILTVGQFINVATGSVGYLLNMSGFEKDYMRATLLSGFMSIISSLILMLNIGVVGAAVGVTIGVATQNLFAAFYVRKRIGFYPV